MKNNRHCCERMALAVESEEIPVSYSAKFREYGIDILDGGTSTLSIGYCPWCGTKLPDSLRDTWFDRLAELGVDPTTDVIPEIFEDCRWYSQQ